MQKVFQEVASLDASCYDTYALSPELLMEHAAQGLAQAVRLRFARGSRVLIVAGSGHNGADGIACARLLHGDYAVKLLQTAPQKSALGQLQETRASAVGVPKVFALESADVYIDALYGSGLNRSLDTQTHDLINALNACEGYKIACDIPSGIHASGACESAVFRADVTLTMGALKLALFSNGAKNFTGEITVIDLGISHGFYAPSTPFALLEPSDMKLPLRLQANVHKGSFGHVAVFCGQKEGASIMTALAALHFGAGLATLVGMPDIVPFTLMTSQTLPSNTTAVAAGMGWGSDASIIKTLYDLDLPMVLDADLFYQSDIAKLLSKPCVITPHPKEFLSLLKLTHIAEIDMAALEADRFDYVRAFATAFPNTVLLLKGAHVLIASGEKIYINPHGTQALSKGGSGDVLAGLIAALLSQGYTPLEAAVSGSLAHTLAARKVAKNNYALTPNDLIEAVGTL